MSYGKFPGIVLLAAVAAASLAVARCAWFENAGISALTVAIVLGMMFGNTFSAGVSRRCDAGVSFGKQTLLRAGIVLYGLRLTIQDIGHVGVTGVAIDALVLVSTFALAWGFGTRVLGLDRRLVLLIGAGSSICGAAAVLATEPVVRGRPADVSVAVATVVVFGTLALFLYPALYHLNAAYRLIELSPALYGIYAGSTIHEVAQVVAAGRSIGEAAANTAVITKMVRVMMLAPFLLILSTSLGGGRRAVGEMPATEGRFLVPWFALGFAAVAGLNSLAVLPAAFVAAAMQVDAFLLAMAMAALGVTTRLSSLRTAGSKPLLLAGLLFLWLIGGGLAINRAVVWLGT